MYYYIISIALITLGFVLMFFTDKLIKPSTNNTFLKFVHDNNITISIACIVLGYYTSTLCELPKTHITEISDVGHLPSYDESMSTDAVLRM